MPSNKNQSGKTFAKLAQEIAKKYKDRFDPISERGRNSEMTALKEAQETVRQEKFKEDFAKENMGKILAYGGTIDNTDPFDAAFAKAKKEGLSKFTWNGKEYNTETAEELVNKIQPKNNQLDTDLMGLGKALSLENSNRQPGSFSSHESLYPYNDKVNDEIFSKFNRGEVTYKADKLLWNALYKKAMKDSLNPKVYDGSEIIPNDKMASDTPHVSRNQLAYGGKMAEGGSMEIPDAPYQSNPKEIYDYLVQEKGLSNIHALGILANIEGESKFDSAAYNPDDKGKPSGGLIQWRDDRLEKMKKSVSNWEDNWKGQIDYMLGEDRTPEYLKQIFQTPEEAVEWFGRNVERFGNADQTVQKRIGFLSKYNFADPSYTYTPQSSSPSEIKRMGPENYNLILSKLDKKAGEIAANPTEQNLEELKTLQEMADNFGNTIEKITPDKRREFIVKNNKPTVSLESIEKGVPLSTKERKGFNTEDLRYAPILTNALNLLGKKPETQEAYINRATPQQTRFDKVDMSALERAITNRGRATEQSITGVSGGNAGSFLSNQLANQMNQLRATGEARMQATQQDTQIDAMNAQEQARIDQFNANIQGQNNQMRMTTDDINARNRAASQGIKAGALAQIGTDIGNVGREEWAKNMVTKYTKYNQDLERVPDITSNKYGGYLLRRKKK